MERAPELSAERQGVEGTTEEMGAGACTQTPGAPAAGRSAAATRLRDKGALPHGDSDVPIMAPLTPALKSTINTSSSAEAALPNGESGAAVDGTAMPSSPVRPVVWLDVFRSPTPEDLACRTPRTPKARDGFRQRVVRSGTADSIDGHTQRAKPESITHKLTASARHWNVDDWRDFWIFGEYISQNRSHPQGPKSEFKEVTAAHVGCHCSGFSGCQKRTFRGLEIRDLGILDKGSWT